MVRLLTSTVRKGFRHLDLHLDFEAEDENGTLGFGDAQFPAANSRTIFDEGNWYDLTKGQYIQGLVARDHQEQRIYVVTVTPELEDAVHERWPRVLNRS